MLVIRSRSAAQAFIDIAGCAVLGPRLVEVIESLAPTPVKDAGALRDHLERTLRAAKTIRAACCESPRKGMLVAIDVRDPSIRAALQAMTALYLENLPGDELVRCDAETDAAEIRMTIQAILDRVGHILPMQEALRMQEAPVHDAPPPMQEAAPARKRRAPRRRKVPAASEA